MRSRIFKIKKSTILQASFALAFILFCFTSIYFIFFSKFKDFWFFAFLIEAGFCVLLRGAFLRIDSSYYFGALMLSIGALYFYCFFMNIFYVFPAFILMGFALASLFSYAFFHNRLHAKSFVFFIFCALFTFFFQINVLPLAFFVAIICFSVLIFILSNMI